MMDAASKGNYLVLFQKNKSQIIKNISFAIHYSKCNSLFCKIIRKEAHGQWCASFDVQSESKKLNRFDLNIKLKDRILDSFKKKNRLDE